MRLARRTALRRRPSYRLRRLGRGGGAVRANAARWPPRRRACATCTPADVAAPSCRNLPLAQRRQLAEAMDDERLADLLEELPEAEQLRIIEGLDLERLVSVLEEMEYDDAADLLGRDAGRAAHTGARRDGRRGRRASCAACSPTTRAPPAA